jgi:single-strand DNA-binding protein
MNDITITVQGFLGADPVTRPAGEAEVTTFNIGHTPRYYSRKHEQWVDGETQWYRVHAWRQLGANAAQALKLGHPVVVTGRLVPRPWTTEDGQARLSLEIEATHIGHDLNLGATTFTRNPRPGEDLRDGRQRAEDAFAATLVEPSRHEASEDPWSGAEPTPAPTPGWAAPGTEPAAETAAA